MARKSRKNIPEVVSSATVQTEVSRPFRAGLYARISMETEETLERGTIETQVELMKNFVADTEDIAVAEHVAFYNDVKEQMSDKFVDGENLAMVMLEDGNHAWTSWITDLYNSLLVFFKK